LWAAFTIFLTAPVLKRVLQYYLENNGKEKIFIFYDNIKILDTYYYTYAIINKQ